MNINFIPGLVPDFLQHFAQLSSAESTWVNPGKPGPARSLRTDEVDWDLVDPIPPHATPPIAKAEIQ